MGRLILHITTRSAWEAARRSGRYEPPSLESEGFIHFSEPEQVVAVANAAFSGTRNVVLLCVPLGRLEVPVRYESCDASGELFPHLYGPLPVEAVACVVTFKEGPAGFALPAQLAP